MPPKKFSTTWQAPPHTIAKIEMLQAYLVAWFQILGRTRRNQEILYVDGFSGPGEYTNYPVGSPLAALTSARNAIELTGASWIAGKIHCAFIEADLKRFDHLLQLIQTLPKHDAIVVHTYRKAFTEGLAGLRNELPRSFQAQQPLFVFIDPFGATGVPFSSVKEILASSCSEVLINFDADGIARIFRAGEHASYDEHLNSIFDGVEWKPLLDARDASEVFYRKLLRLYKTKLLAIEKVKYVFSFEMRTSANALNYYLVFASQHPLGLQKMKESMRSIDQSGNYCFSDASVGQPALFKFDDLEQHSVALNERFRGRRVEYWQLQDFALNETPFTNPKAMLRILECDKGLIEEVKSSDPRRRKGTFNEEKLIYVRFRP